MLATEMPQTVHSRYSDDSPVYLPSVAFPFSVQVHFLWPLSRCERSPGGLVRLAARLAAHSTATAVKLLLKLV